MKYENFNLIGTSKEYMYATVEAVTWYGRRRSVALFKTPESRFWRFMETGECTPGHVIEFMYDAYKARKQKEAANVG